MQEFMLAVGSGYIQIRRSTERSITLRASSWQLVRQRILLAILLAMGSSYLAILLAMGSSLIQWGH